MVYQLRDNATTKPVKSYRHPRSPRRMTDRAIGRSKIVPKQMGLRGSVVVYCLATKRTNARSWWLDAVAWRWRSRPRQNVTSKRRATIHLRQPLQPLVARADQSRSPASLDATLVVASRTWNTLMGWASFPLLALAWLPCRAQLLLRASHRSGKVIS